MKDGAELLALLAGLPQVKAVFFGHTHHWELSTHQGLHLINLPAVSYAATPDLVTGWVDCRLQAGGMTLELRATEPAFPEHGKLINFVWRS